MTYTCNWGLFFPFQQACWDTNCNKRVCWSALTSTCVRHHHECSMHIERRKKTQNWIEGTSIFIEKKNRSKARCVHTQKGQFWDISRNLGRTRIMVHTLFYVSGKKANQWIALTFFLIKICCYMKFLINFQENFRKNCKTK